MLTTTIIATSERHLFATAPRAGGFVRRAKPPGGAARALATAALSASLVATTAGCGGPSVEQGDPPAAEVSTEGAIHSCPVGQSWQCTHEGLHGSLLCGCEPDAVPKCPSGSLICSKTGSVSTPVLNASVPVQWQDTCIVNTPGAFTGTVDWGDGTVAAMPGGAVGCYDHSCTTSTIYNSEYHHLYGAAGKYQVKVTIGESQFNQSCSFALPVAVGS